MLKKKGIYIFLDTLVHREFSKEDGIKTTTPLGAKQVGFYPKIESEYYKDMNTYFRQLEVKYPLSGSNYPVPFLAPL